MVPSVRQMVIRSFKSATNFKAASNFFFFKINQPSASSTGSPLDFFRLLYHKKAAPATTGSKMGINFTRNMIHSPRERRATMKKIPMRVAHFKFSTGEMFLSSALVFFILFVYLGYWVSERVRETIDPWISSWIVFNLKTPKYNVLWVIGDSRSNTKFCVQNGMNPSPTLKPYCMIELVDRENS